VLIECPMDVSRSIYGMYSSTKILANGSSKTVLASFKADFHARFDLLWLYRHPFKPIISCNVSIFDLHDSIVKRATFLSSANKYWLISPVSAQLQVK